MQAIKFLKSFKIGIMKLSEPYFKQTNLKLISLDICATRIMTALLSTKFQVIFIKAIFHFMIFLVLPPIPGKVLFLKYSFWKWDPSSGLY